jgi:hypothetical protein
LTAFRFFRTSVIHDLKQAETGFHFFARLEQSCTSCFDTSASAALRSLVGTVSLRADQLAFWLGARDGLSAFPFALELSAHGLALERRRHTERTAGTRLADNLALGATCTRAHVLGASNLTDGFVALDLALRVGKGITLHLALGSIANWMADSRALGVITLPRANRSADFFRRKSKHK